MPDIILLEDDAVLSKEVKKFLVNNDFNCDCVFDGGLVSKQIRLKTYDLAILDVNVPGINGFEVCRLIREFDQKIPIIMLTAYGEIDDKLNAFNLGADDYLVKPFNLSELLIRIKSLLRRKEAPQLQNKISKISDLTIDHEKQRVFRAGTEINLSPKEFKLLSILCKAHGRVLSKSQIADELWDFQIETNANTIEVYINFLRKKIDRDFEEKLIHTKVGYGYYLKDDK